MGGQPAYPGRGRASLVSDIAWDAPVSTLSGQRRQVQLTSLLVVANGT